ncbi:MAG: F0F1 ATP synthase subunit A [Clostridia bacterium]|nr:F0F1 ATP synthase subunit A [Clostridia bacterium]
MALKVCFSVSGEGVQIAGAQIYFTIPMPLMDMPFTEAQVNSWMVIISVWGLCLFMTHGLKVKADTRRQHLAEWCVTMCKKLVNENMGEFFAGYTPFIGAIMAISLFSSLMSLLGLFAPTSDLNVVAGWAILVFALITAAKCRCGPLLYMKSFCEPIPVMLPMNIISELATPISMAFRHYGNVMSGAVISVLISSALSSLSRMVLGWLPGVLGDIPFLRVGIPAVLSIYFDVFSGCLQAFIFAMLTMLYVSGGFPMEEYLRRKAADKQPAKKQSVRLFE